MARRLKIARHQVCGTLDELADATGVPRATLGRWKKQGARFVRSDGRYCTRMLQRWHDAQAEESGGRDDSEDEEQLSWEGRDKRARALLREQALARELGRVVYTEDVAAAMMEVSGVLREMQRRLQVELGAAGPRAFEIARQAIQQLEGIAKRMVKSEEGGD